MEYIIKNNRPAEHGRDIEITVDVGSAVIAEVKKIFSQTEGPVSYKMQVMKDIMRDVPGWYEEMRMGIGEVLTEWVDERPQTIELDENGDRVDPEYECYFDYGYSSGDESDYNRLTYDLLTQIRDFGEDRLEEIERIADDSMTQEELKGLLAEVCAICDKQELLEGYKDMISPDAEDVLLYSAYEAGDNGCGDQDGGVQADMYEYYENDGPVTALMIRFAIDQIVHYREAMEIAED